MHCVCLQLLNGTLLFSSVTQADAGLYTCLASNSQGTAQVTFQLDLTELGELATGGKLVCLYKCSI